jgi:hypothetical protein
MKSLARLRAIDKTMKWIKGFFEQGTSQSMTRLISLIIALSGVVYLFIKFDYIGTVSIFAVSGAVKITGKHIRKADGGSKKTEAQN